MLLKLDVFFFVTFSVGLAVLVLSKTDYEYYVTLGAVGVIPIVLLLAVFGLRNENSAIMFGVLAGFVAGMAYFIFKLFRIYSKDKSQAFEGNSRHMTFLGKLMCVALMF
jgi:hypothetical protein